MSLHIVANTTYFDPLPQEREPEEATFQKPYTDKEIRRTNPKRTDERTDWTEMNNEKGHDSDVANRYSALPVSVLLFKLEEMCLVPTREAFVQVRRMIRYAAQPTKAIVYDYVQDQLSLVEWHREHMAKVASTDLAIRYFLLSKLFE